MTREQKITLTSLIITIGFVVSAFYHYAAGMYGNLAYPYNTFLFGPTDRFMDFVWPFNISANPYLVARPDFQNFPALYRLASLFALLPLPIALILFMLLFVFGFFRICQSQLKVADRLVSFQNAFIFTFLAYPFLFALDRENFEIVAFFCLFFFVFWYRKNPLLSAILLGVAIALKGFPVILAILLFSDRRFKEILIAAGVALGTTFLSYISYPGGLVVNITNHLRNLSLYNAFYATKMAGLSFGNSLFGAIKFIGLLFHPGWVQTGTPQGLVTAYTIIILIVLALLSLYVIFIEKDFWKKVTLLVCALNLFPLVSGDYKLLHLFIPLFLFINETAQKKSDRLILVLFALLLIPKDYFHLPILPETSISILLNPLLMLTLMAVLIVNRLKPASLTGDGPNLAQSPAGN